jgi:hypothetical protein
MHGMITDIKTDVKETGWDARMWAGFVWLRIPLRTGNFLIS